MLDNELVVAARVADLDREITRGALARTLSSLYGACRCGRRTQEQATPCERHAVDPGLFRRLVWSGLGS